MLVLTSVPFLTFLIFFPFTVVGAFKLIVVFVSLDTFPLLLTSTRCFSSKPDDTSLISDSRAVLLEEAVVAAPLDKDGGAVVAAPLDVDGVFVAVAAAVAVALLEAPLGVDGVADVASPLDDDCVAVAAAFLEAALDVDGVAFVAVVATLLDIDGVAVVAIVAVVATLLDVDGVAACPSSTKLMSSGETCPLTPSDQVGCLEKWIEHPPQMKLKLSVSKKKR